MRDKKGVLPGIPGKAGGRRDLPLLAAETRLLVHRRRGGPALGADRSSSMSTGLIAMRG